MTNTTTTTENFLVSKELRQQHLNRTEVLDKVKSLFLIPKMECMTIQQVADYYEVDVETIKKCYQRNEDEFSEDGANKFHLSEVKSLIGTKCPNLKTVNYRGRMEIEFGNNQKLVVPNVGIILFPKRAILRMGMLLRDSKIAKEIRTQLLNTFEHTTDEQKINDIDKETELLNGIGRAFGSGNGVEVLQACMELDNFRKRHITELREENSKLAEENKQISAEKKLLAADILKWTDRASANRLIRVLAGKIHNTFAGTFGMVYKELQYRFHICVKQRGDKPWIQHLKDHEWIYLYKVVAALCETNNINISKLFADAKVDVSTLCLE